MCKHAVGNWARLARQVVVASSRWRPQLGGTCWKVCWRATSIALKQYAKSFVLILNVILATKQHRGIFVKKIMKHLPYLTHLKSASVLMQKRMASLEECRFHRDLVASCALNGYGKAGNDVCYCKKVVCMCTICYYLIQRSQHSCNSISVDRTGSDKFKIGNKYDSD